MRKNTRLREILVSALILIFFVINLSPLLIALSTSFRKVTNAMSPLLLFREFSMESYKLAVQKMDFARSFMNSALVEIVSVALVVLFTSMAGYALARLKTRTGTVLHVFFMAGMIVSAQMSIIPIYMIIRNLGLADSRVAPVLLYITSTIAFSVFLYTSFIRSGVPVSLEEAALIDGAGPFQTYWQIVFPLILPATTAVIITQGVYIWNDFFFSMMFLSAPSKKTLPVAMLRFVGDVENSTLWSTLFAACYLCSLPLIIGFGFLQRYFMGGLTVGAVKG